MGFSSASASASAGKRHLSEVSSASPVPCKKNKPATSIASTASTASSSESVDVEMEYIPLLRLEPRRPSFREIRYEAATPRCKSPQPTSPKSL